MDLLVDEILVGLSLAHRRAQGVALTIALTLVGFPLALAATAELFDRDASPAKAALIPSATSRSGPGRRRSRLRPG